MKHKKMLMIAAAAVVGLTIPLVLVLKKKK